MANQRRKKNTANKKKVDASGVRTRDPSMVDCKQKEGTP